MIEPTTEAGRALDEEFGHYSTSVLKGIIAIEAEARELDVDRLAQALRNWEVSSDPEALGVSARLGVAIYEEGEVEVARAIAAEYVRLLPRVSRGAADAMNERLG